MTKYIKGILVAKMAAKCNEVAEWFRDQFRRRPAPFYCSVDLRDAGYKIAPIDCNVYPAGFNNVCQFDRQASSPVIAREIAKYHPDAKKVLLIPENNTRNLGYLENVRELLAIIRNGGFEVELGWYDPKEPNPVVLRASSGDLTALPVSVSEHLVRAGDFTPDVVVINNDFSSGYPADLKNLKQPVVPTMDLGWHSRRKDRHFAHYNQLAADFSGMLDLDPWFLQVETKLVEPVDMLETADIDRVAEVVQATIDEVADAYQRNSIQAEPVVFVKSNTGTYGMGVHAFRSTEEFRKINRRKKDSLRVGKNRLKTTAVIVQEGLSTATLHEGLPAEPVMYLVGDTLIGGFLRANSQKSADENLNSKGMILKTFCMSDLENLLNYDQEQLASDCGNPMELIYGSVARLSALAAAHEMPLPPAKT